MGGISSGDCIVSEKANLYPVLLINWVTVDFVIVFKANEEDALSF